MPRINIENPAYSSQDTLITQRVFLNFRMRFFEVILRKHYQKDVFLYLTSSLFWYKFFMDLCCPGESFEELFSMTTLALVLFISIDWPLLYVRM